jgi:thermolysin
VWTDGAVVDEHAYAGFTYDYYFTRHGRHGLDNADIPIRSITHAIRREDWVLYTTETVDTFFANAFYLGDGIMYYGDGLPPNVVFFGQHVNYLAGALDIVAHELTHGVTDYSSALIYRNESGALNEAFSDMMGAAVEFAFQPEKADYLCAEDVFTPAASARCRTPQAFGDPDHYSIRFTGSGTTAACTSTAASRTTPTTSRSKAVATGWARPSRAWGAPTAHRSSACSTGPSPPS